MNRKSVISAILVILVTLAPATVSRSGVRVETVDFLKCGGLRVNAAGPFLLRMDEERNRLVAANTLSSSITIIDCDTEEVRNIPVGGRGLQHLKSEALFIDSSTGIICLIGTKSIHIVDPESASGKSVETGAQFESAAVCGGSGNIFLAGRETGKLGFYKASTGEMLSIDWLDKSEPLLNLNATPPPPIRKVVPDNKLGVVIAFDGYTSTVFLFDAADGSELSSRKIPVEPAARWHLAGYDEKNHFLYVVAENSNREVVQAAKIDIQGNEDTVVELPGYREGVGIIYSGSRDEVYIPYDNHPTVHAVGFENGGEVFEIKIPAYGNDASAVDEKRGILYVASWAHGEIDVIDLKSRKLFKRIPGLGIIPHMFSMVFNAKRNLLYFPKGATAVNGTFGAAVTVVDPETGKAGKIRTGWAPVDLIEAPDRNSFLVFNSEDMFAEVYSDGNYQLHSLDQDYPVKAVTGPEGNIYLSYGPHQSYWPVVYIWGARNGVLGIDSKTLEFYDRRIVRQALGMALDGEGVLYLTQNNWGAEKQFIARLIDEVRLFEPGRRIELADTVQRETTQRVLDYDPGTGLLYLVRTGERDDESSVLQVVDPDSGKAVAKIETGLNSTDAAFDDDYILVCCFDSGEITIVRKSDYQSARIETGGAPLKLLSAGGSFYAIDHTGGRLVVIDRGEIDRIYAEGNKSAGRKAFRSCRIPMEGMPDNIFIWKGDPVISVHGENALSVLRFDTRKETFDKLLEFDYPYGDVSFESPNSSFFMRGQFGDAVFSLCAMKQGGDGRLWITDFLAGKLFIIE